ncbi:MAG: ATP-grasp domain-containing protein [Desulfotomaculum sp.]|nr:ATP-grasp domain-containing protein [Desulfotomaculum sp.]
MKKVNVLVTGSGSLYGVAIVKSLVSGPLNCRVVACDTDVTTLGLYLAHQGYLVPPASETQDWLHKIMEICRQEEIRCILICSSHEIQAFAKYKDFIYQETGAKVFVNPLKVVRLCSDKWLTVKFLKENNYYYPRTIRWPEDRKLLPDFIKKDGFPLVAKPRVGAGSQGIAVVRSIKELNEFISGKDNYVIQEYLPENDGEFTVGVCMGSYGKALSCITLKRKLQDGMTMSALAGDYSEICNYCQAVARDLNTYGPCNFQLRLKNGFPYIFEINPRFSSSTGMRIELGVNEAELLIRSEVLGQTVKRPQIKKACVIRQFSDYVIPIEKVNKFTSSNSI